MVRYDVREFNLYSKTDRGQLSHSVATDVKIKSLNERTKLKSCSAK